MDPQANLIMKLFKRRAKPAGPEEGERSDADTQSSETTASSSTSFYQRLKSGLSRSRGQLGEGLASLLLGKKQLDGALAEALEEQLIMADLGVATTQQVLEQLRQRLSRQDMGRSETVMDMLKATLVELLADQEAPLDTSGSKPFVILVVGVNGAGKTTTIGKLAHRFKQQGLNVMLAAGDTFRAAAVEQLQA